jgi:hypothetical protein
MFLSLLEEGKTLTTKIDNVISIWEETGNRFGDSTLSISSLDSVEMNTIIAAGGWAPTFLLFNINLESGTLIKNLPSWLRDKFVFYTKNDYLPTNDISDTTESGFGNIINSLADTTREQGIAPQSGFGKLINGSIHKVANLSQGGDFGNAACFPTSISMISHFYHEKNPSNPIIDSHDIITRADPGDGTAGKGFGMDKLTDEIKEYGYKNILITVGESNSLESLRNTVENHPVIIAGGVTIQGNGSTNMPESNRAITGIGNTIHAMVVKGFSSNGEEIILNDPWSGKEIRWETKKFEVIWEKGKRTIVNIQP